MGASLDKELRCPFIYGIYSSLNAQTCLSKQYRPNCSLRAVSSGFALFATQLTLLDKTNSDILDMTMYNTKVFLGVLPYDFPPALSFILY